MILIGKILIRQLLSDISIKFPNIAQHYFHRRFTGIRYGIITLDSSYVAFIFETRFIV